MPRKAKPSPKPESKPAPKTTNPYPNPLPPSLQSHPATAASHSKTSSNSSYDAQLADWTAKNARAKAIIMSTLVPGSEPWQIAEPLEYAADIWKALEEKYGPNSEKRDGNENDIRHDGDYDQTTDRGWQDRLTGNQATGTNDGLAQELSDGLQEVAELWTREQEKGIARSTAANTRLSEDKKKKWSNDSMRDQRFLWALLNGGKEEEVGRIVGTKDRALGAAG